MKRRLNRYWLIVLGIMVFFLVTFLVIEAFEIPLLTNTDLMQENGGAVAALVGLALLWVDILLPIPSSLIMIANGALFGMWIGAALSLVGGLGASMIGFYLGSKGAKVISKWISIEEQERATRILKRWGPLAIILSRPIPILAETVAIFAGAAGIKPGKMVGFSLLGLVPTVLIYAFTGQYANDMESGMYAFLLVAGVATLFFIIGRMWRPPVEESQETQ